VLTVDEFLALLPAAKVRAPNQEQERCLRHALDAPLLITAGPGTGKTTVLVLRALRHLLVDGVPP